MPTPIFTDWSEKHSAVWGKVPLRLAHRLHQHELFARDTLAKLIETYPREHYALVHMGGQKDKRFWREGDFGGLTGHEVMDAITKGRMWIHLFRVNQNDTRYKKLLDEIFDEVAANVPGYVTSDRINGIIISSPLAQVYYHFDPAGQSLWQIEGRKRVYLYPPTAPFLSDKSLEHVALYRDEVGIAYEPWYDEFATVYELQPGQMMHWPLNCPHRIENLDCVNISMTTEYFTDDIRKKSRLNTANGILRDKLGITPKSRATEGLAYLAKSAMQSAVWRTGLLEKARKQRRPIEFRLDKANLGQIIDLAASGKGGEATLQTALLPASAAAE
jgi:hypothetical protein